MSIVASLGWIPNKKGYERGLGKLKKPQRSQASFWDLFKCETQGLRVCGIQRTDAQVIPTSEDPLCKKIKKKLKKSK